MSNDIKEIDYEIDVDTNHWTTPEFDMFDDGIMKVCHSLKEAMVFSVNLANNRPKSVQGSMTWTKSLWTGIEIFKNVTINGKDIPVNYHWELQFDTNKCRNLKWYKIYNDTHYVPYSKVKELQNLAQGKDKQVYHKGNTKQDLDDFLTKNHLNSTASDVLFDIRNHMTNISNEKIVTSCDHVNSGKLDVAIAIDEEIDFEIISINNHPCHLYIHIVTIKLLNVES